MIVHFALTCRARWKCSGLSTSRVRRGVKNCEGLQLHFHFRNRRPGAAPSFFPTPPLDARSFFPSRKIGRGSRAGAAVKREPRIAPRVMIYAPPVFPARVLSYKGVAHPTWILRSNHGGIYLS